MSRFYSVSIDNGAVTAATDLFELTAATNIPIRIWGWNISQDTDTGDAAEEVLQLYLKHAVTAGSGGTAVTPSRHVPSDVAASATCNRNVSTAATGGTVVATRGWNIRMPEDHWFTPESAPVFHAGNDPVVLSNSAPADSITVSGYLIFEEIA